MEIRLRTVLLLNLYYFFIQHFIPFQRFTHILALKFRVFIFDLLLKRLRLQIQINFRRFLSHINDSASLLIYILKFLRRFFFSLLGNILLAFNIFCFFYFFNFLQIFLYPSVLIQSSRNLFSKIHKQLK